VVLKEAGPEGVEIIVKSPPSQPAANTIEVDGRPLAIAPPHSRVTVFLNPNSTGLQTVVLKGAGQDRVAISLIAPPARFPTATVAVSPQPVVAPDSPAALIAECEQAAFVIRSQGLITPRNARTGIQLWEAWKEAHRDVFAASPQLDAAYKEVLVAIRMHTAGDPH
jgi:hypothetical protein